ncbi:MAG: hypothetical protein H6594_05805 [Flavobacteriales bacterium]|nr:hypothetical protein [Flavobacteriales bacterium]
MKRALIIAALLVGTTSIRAQEGASSKDKEAMQAPLKEHVCTDACKQAGHHVYAHGEKGHVCSEECMKMHGEEGMREHVCTDACKKAGHHVYAHGEKGHVCSEECMKMHQEKENRAGSGTM